MSAGFCFQQPAHPHGDIETKGRPGPGQLAYPQLRSKSARRTEQRPRREQRGRDEHKPQTRQRQAPPREQPVARLKHVPWQCQRPHHENEKQRRKIARHAGPRRHRAQDHRSRVQRHRRAHCCGGDDQRIQTMQARPGKEINRQAPAARIPAIHRRAEHLAERERGWRERRHALGIPGAFAHFFSDGVDREVAAKQRRANRKAGQPAVGQRFQRLVAGQRHQRGDQPDDDWRSDQAMWRQLQPTVAAQFRVESHQ